MGLVLRSHDRWVSELEESGPEGPAQAACSHAREERDGGAGWWYYEPLTGHRWTL